MPKQTKQSTDARDAERWRKIRPWLAVNHVYDVGRIGVAPKHIARLEFPGFQEHPLKIEEAESRGPDHRFTIEEVVDAFTPTPKKRL